MSIATLRSDPAMLPQALEDLRTNARAASESNLSRVLGQVHKVAVANGSLESLNPDWGEGRLKGSHALLLPPDVALRQILTVPHRLGADRPIPHLMPAPGHVGVLFPPFSENQPPDPPLPSADPAHFAQAHGADGRFELKAILWPNSPIATTRLGWRSLTVSASLDLGYVVVPPVPALDTIYIEAAIGVTGQVACPDPSPVPWKEEIVGGIFVDVFSAYGGQHYSASAFPVLAVSGTNAPTNQDFDNDVYVATSTLPAVPNDLLVVTARAFLHVAAKTDSQTWEFADFADTYQGRGGFSIQWVSVRSLPGA
jgi:hypothetical protein